MNTSDKLVFFFLERISERKITGEDLEHVFETNSYFKEFFLTKTLSFPIKSALLKEKNEQMEKILEESVLKIPAMNVLLYFTQKLYLSNRVLKIFKDEIIPFQECYIESKTEKRLVHGLDVFSLFNISIKESDEFVKTIPLNIRSLEQYYTFLKLTVNAKMDTGIPYNLYKLSEWEYNKHISCNIEFHELFTKKNYNNIKEKNNEVTLILGENQSINLSLPLQVSISNIPEANQLETKEMHQFLLHKVVKNEIDFKWDIEKLITLLTTPNNLMLESNDILLVIKTILNQEPNILSKEVMVLLYLKNKNVYENLKKLINNEELNMIENSTKMDLESDMEQNTLSNWEEYIEKMNAIVMKNQETDIALCNIWAKIKVQLDFLLEERSINYFMQSLEEKITFEQMLSTYIGKVLENYFNIPLRLRINDKNNYLEMTTMQFSKIQDQLEKFEVAILEEDMKKMKVYGNFLNERLGEDTSIIKLSPLNTMKK